MDFTTLIALLSQQGIWIVIKIMILIIVFLYILFAFVIVRQIKLMREAVEIAPTEFLQLIAVVHLFASIAILILAIILL